MSQFAIKTKIQFGKGSLESLNILKDKRIFIVTDPFMVKSGLIDHVTKQLEGNEYQLFTDIVPDPPMEVVASGVQALLQFKPDKVLALGGGSAIDAAKAIMDFSRQIGNLDEICFVAIPTTSGTGSEVTSFAVITDKEKGVKHPLVSDRLLPDEAILDPILVASVPGSIAADTGMDVLTHALEAYVSTKATDFSDALAEKAICLVCEYLYDSYLSGDNELAREKMHNASCLAGLAFNMTSLGANHAMAHVIGSQFHISHGRANSILLPHIIECNADIQGYHPASYSVAAQKYAYIAQLLGIHGGNIRMSVRNLINEIVKLQRKMEMPTTLSQCKPDIDRSPEMAEVIAQAALADSCMATNPRIPTADEIKEIFNKII